MENIYRELSKIFKIMRSLSHIFVEKTDISSKSDQEMTKRSFETGKLGRSFLP